MSINRREQKELIKMLIKANHMPIDQKLCLLNGIFAGAELNTVIRHTADSFVIVSTEIVSDRLLEERPAKKQDDYIQ